MKNIFYLYFLVPASVFATDAADLFKKPADTLNDIIDTATLILSPLFVIAIIFVGIMVFNGRFPRSYLISTIAGMFLVILANPIVTFIFDSLKVSS